MIGVIPTRTKMEILHFLGDYRECRGPVLQSHVHLYSFGERSYPQTGPFDTRLILTVIPKDNRRVSIIAVLEGWNTMTLILEYNLLIAGRKNPSISRIPLVYYSKLVGCSGGM